MAQELDPIYATNPLNPLGSDGLAGIYWRGSDGNIYTQNNLGQIVKRTGGGILTRGNQTFDGATWREVQAPSTGDDTEDKQTDLYTGYTGTGSTTPALDQAKIDSLNKLLASYDTDRSKAYAIARAQRDASRNEKDREREGEKGKYDSSKLTTLQDFGSATNDTMMNTRDTLTNLMSSLSTLGLGGGKALTRQILNASNRANREANSTQARSNRELDSAWNEYDSGYKDDIEKIGDQYSYAKGEADKNWGRSRQNALYQIADVYNASDMAGERQNYMNKGDALASFISNSTFSNPKYTGNSRAMATPELADYSQDIAQYKTTGVTGNAPVGAGAPAGNLAIKAVAMNDKDLGVKKKTEGSSTYGV